MFDISISRRYIILLFMLMFGNLSAQKLQKPTIRDFTHFTFAGQIGMTITNYGILGEGYETCQQPSCRYKLYSDYKQEQVEHFSYAGLWVGGIKNNQVIVSSAITDGFVSDEYGSRPAGREYSSTADSNDVVQIKSSFSKRTLDPIIQQLASYYDSSAISHQDMIAEFTDTAQIIPGTEIQIPHTPLGIKVHLETYCWNYPYANSFVILNYRMKNISGEEIINPCVGLWVDASVGNMNFTSICEPGGGWSWYDNRNNFVDSLALAYQTDLDGDQGWAQSYFGVKYLGSSDDSGTDFDIYYDQWPWNGSQLQGVDHHSTPLGDDELYERMHLYPGSDYDLITEPASWMVLISAGPFGNIINTFNEQIWEPDSEIVVTFAVVCGLWASDSQDDTEERREELYENARWAQKAYDLGYKLPGPPPTPNMYVVPSNQQITVYWDDTAEDPDNPEAYDPVTEIIDFEGYRIYSGRKTGIGTESTLLGQYDIIDEFDVQPLGFTNYNTGLDQVRIYDNDGNPSSEWLVIDGDSVEFQYKYVDYDLKNGWPARNWYSVVSFDFGDASNNIESSESASYKVYAIPGTKTNSNFEKKVGVYPNPYRAKADWDGYGEKERMLWFTNLPSRAEIRIYTLSGELIDAFNHNAETYDGSDIELLSEVTFGKEPVFSGGEHGWDLISKYNQAIAAGLYMFSVEDLDNNKISIGKFAIIK